MADIQKILVKAIPRLREGDTKATKLKSGILKRGISLWARGPARLGKLGLLVPEDDYREITSDGDAFLDELYEILGEKRFIRFLQLVKSDFAKKLKEKKRQKKESGSAKRDRSRGEKREKREKRERGEKREKREKRKPADDVPDALKMSDHDDGSGMDLALPDDDDGMDLALPDDDGMDLAIPGLEDDGPADEPAEIDLDNLEMVTDQPLSLKPFEEEGAAASDDAGQGGERALKRYRETGDIDELKTAKQLYKRAVKEAKGPVAQGAARGGLALTYLLDGELDKARDQAKKALKAFPNEPTAIGVLCRAEWPNEVERERLRATLRRADRLIDEGSYEELVEVIKTLKAEHPKEPYAALVQLAELSDKRQENLKEPIKKAWKRYPPSAELADIQLGPALDRAIITGCLGWLEAQVKDDDGTILGKTVKDVESKDNVVAGAFQIPLGVARSALAGRAKLSKEEAQEVTKWVADSLFAAQYYDAAKDVYGRARSYDRNTGLVPHINKAETQCGVMRRAFDRPGVKAKNGKLDGVGMPRYRKAVARRLKLVLADLEGDRAKLDQKEAALVEAILADPQRQKKLKAAAKKGDQEDPFGRFEDLLAQEGELAAKKVEPASKKGGLFGRMKNAAKGALDKAKGAVVASKKKEAMKALGRRLRDRPDGGWGDKELDAFLDKLQKVEPRLDFLEEEAEKLRGAAGKAGDSV